MRNLLLLKKTFILAVQILLESGAIIVLDQMEIHVIVVIMVV